MTSVVRERQLRAYRTRQIDRCLERRNGEGKRESVQT